METMRRSRVLVVDDEPMVREVLARYLSKEGFDVDIAADGEAALSAFERARPDLVLLDLMLPAVDGFDVFRRMQASGRPAVIMLTARGDEVDRILGLEMGADDYVTKPFSPREIVARVRAVLRRSVASEPESRENSAPAVELDPKARRRGSAARSRRRSKRSAPSASA